MSDPKQPQEFEFGELNPIEDKFSRKSFDSHTSDPMRAMREAAIEVFTPNAMEGTGPYKGIVLQVLPDPPKESQPPGDWVANFFGVSTETQDVPVLKRYKIQIPELHAMLPAPTQYCTSEGETGAHMDIINKYPTFVSKDSNTSILHPAGPGDLVWVDFGNRINQTDPTYLGMVFPPPLTPGGVPTSATNPYSSTCGQLSGGNHPGGKLSPDQRSKLSSSGAHFGCPLYLPYKEIKARNKKSPSKGVKRNAGVYLGKVKIQEPWVAKGGHGRSISGILSPGACSKIQNRLARILAAQRIIAEDNSDRGYMLGGKSIDGGVGGIDCSGFVQTVRAGAEYLCSSDGQYFGLPARKDGTKWHRAQMYSAWQYNSQQHTHVKGQRAKIYDGTVHIMPGDEICMGKRSGPTADFAKKRGWIVNGKKYAHGISHVGICIVDPEGHLRFAESGGKHGGGGSM